MASVQPRMDRIYMEGVERAVTEAFLYRMAELVNAATKAGAIYGQVMLSPEEAARKRAAMEQQGQP